MAKRFELKSEGFHPFCALLGIDFRRVGKGRSECVLDTQKRHHNPNGVVHGGVMYTMADTGMAGALYSLMNEGETCATIGIYIQYLRPLTSGRLVCRSRVVHRTRKVAFVESKVAAGRKVAATATGTFSILDNTPAAPGFMQRTRTRSAR
jgi:acyl-CoA thioesterase